MPVAIERFRGDRRVAPMATRKMPPKEVDTLIEKLIVDAHGDDEQLRALHGGIAGAIDLPLDVHVIGSDNQGIRGVLPDVRAREAWVDDEG